MAFVAAMSAPDKTKVGVNGEEVYTEAGVGDRRLALFTMLIRGLEKSYIEEQVAAMNLEDPKIVEDLFVLAFHTRDVRGGKGERVLFHHMMSVLASHVPLAMLERMVPLVPEYGCWRDMWELWKVLPALEGAILSHVKQVWQEDLDKQRKTESISLLAKWLPREGSKTYGSFVGRIATALFPDASKKRRLATYRRHVSNLNAYLSTCEVDMCQGTWASIDPESVPGRAMKLYNAAFLNKRLGPSVRGRKRMAELTLRCPNDEDRMNCRKNFLEFLDNVQKGTAKAKGANVVFPHEITRSLLYCCEKDQEAMLEAQWASIREATAALGGLGRCIPLCDFSGSMSGIPMDISLALGILISEITHPSFRDHILTFDSTPTWHSFVGSKSLKDKICSTQSVGQGLSTDFYKACMLVLRKMEAARIPVGEEPEMLLVLTDMGWDAASGPAQHRTAWSSQIQRIQAEFREASDRVWGSDSPGWKVPTIVVWNLRAEYNDFQAKSDDQGVLTLSGWSPNVLKALQNGTLDQITPMAGLRAILDDNRYDPVRRACVA
jgi:hypothetical protein